MKIALLLSAGMGKGAYQVGALKTLSKYIDFKDVSVVSSASIGTLNGYAFCTGKIKQLEEFWLKASSGKENGFVSKLISSQALKDVIMQTTLTPVERQQFHTLLLSSSLTKRRLEYFNLSEENNSQRRCQILQASVRVPLLGRPLKIDGKNYYDGATVDANPIRPLLENDFDYAIAIYFNKNLKIFDRHEKLKGKVIKLCFDDGTLIKNATVIREKSTREMIEKGEKVAQTVLSHVLRDDAKNVQQVLKNISEYDNICLQGKSRALSSSHMAILLNKVSGLFVKKEK